MFTSVHAWLLLRSLAIAILLSLVFFCHIHHCTAFATFQEVSLTVTGNGDVIEPHDGIIAIGSGGSFALAAARALIDQPGLSALDIARKSMNIAADMCVYTNHNFVEETLSYGDDEEEGNDDAEKTSSAEETEENAVEVEEDELEIHGP